MAARLALIPSFPLSFATTFPVPDRLAARIEHADCLRLRFRLYITKHVPARDMLHAVKPVNRSQTVKLADP